MDESSFCLTDFMFESLFDQSSQTLHENEICRKTRTESTEKLNQRACDLVIVAF